MPVLRGSVTTRLHSHPLTSLARLAAAIPGRTRHVTLPWSCDPGGLAGSWADLSHAAIFNNDGFIIYENIKKIYFFI